MRGATKRVTTAELRDALGAIVRRAQARPAGLEWAVLRWCRDVATPSQVVELAAELRAGLPAGGGLQALLDRATALAVEAVAQRLVDDALIDPLTGLATRGRMLTDLHHLLAVSVRASTPLTAVVLDVDGLKRVNDERGHGAGDAALAEVGRAVRAELRGADRAYRWGGDEFVLLLPDTAAAAAHRVVERIQRSCATAVSAGVATHTGGTNEVDVATWLSAADADLYRGRGVRRATQRAVGRPRGAHQVALASLLGALTVAIGGTGALTLVHQHRPVTAAVPRETAADPVRPVPLAAPPAHVAPVVPPIARTRATTPRAAAARHRPARPGPIPLVPPVIVPPAVVVPTAVVPVVPEPTPVPPGVVPALLGMVDGVLALLR